MKTFVVTILWLLSLVACFYVGSRVGVREFLLADSQYQAAITAGNLRLIEQKRIGELKEVLEISLNASLARHGDYLDSRFTWLWPQMRPETPRAIESAIRYRISHPFKEPSIDLEGADKSFIQGITEEQKHNQQQMERVIREYAE